MRDWDEYVRGRLPLRDVEAHREGHIVEELATQLEDIYREARSMGRSESEADAITREHITDWDALAADIRRQRRAIRAPKAERWLESSEQVLRRRGGGWLSAADMLQELGFAFRRLRKSVGFSAVVLTTLAVGIGANTVIFSLVNGVLLRPLAYEDSERLVSVRASLPNVGQPVFAQSAALHLTYQDRSRVFEDIGLWTVGTAAVTGLDETTNEWLIRLTESTFRVLKARPIVGRAFTAEDDAPGAPPTVILSHAYWRGRFGGDPRVLGQSIRIAGTPTEIIGVMPADFRILQNNPSLFLPFGIDRSTLVAGQFMFQSVARLAPGVTIEEATAELAKLVPVSIEAFPGGMTMDDMNEWGLAPLIRPLKREMIGNVANLLWVLLGMAGVILLIACANVANLSLVRAEGRDREVAVRAAMGAGRSRIAGQFLMEAVGLGVFGGLLGVGLAAVALRSLKALGSTNLPRLNEVALDPTVLLFALCVSVVTGVGFGLLPALRHGRIDLVTALKEGTSGAGTGRRRHRTRNALAVAQVALALVLLVGSGLMVRSFQALKSVDPGFGNTDELLTLRISIPAAEIADVEEMARTHELLARTLADIPGVSGVGLTSKLPMGPGTNLGPVFVEEFPLPDGVPAPAAQSNWIGGDYFATLEIPLLAGQAISWGDVHDRLPVVVVSEGFARATWNDLSDALGSRISTVGPTPGPGDWYEIVGVVGDVRDAGMTQLPRTIVYFPMVTETPASDGGAASIYAPRRLSYAIRSDRTGTPGLLRDVREVINSINPNLPLGTVGTMEQTVSRSLARTSFTLIMLAIGAAVALLLGGVGVYGVIGYVVSQRTKELGVRVALGARPLDVKHLVLRQGLLIACFGVTVGLVASFWATRLMAGLLFGVSPLDPVTYGAVALGVTGVTLLASYVPARRAASVDPLDALRAE